MESMCCCGHVYDEHEHGCACAVEGCRCVCFDGIDPLDYDDAPIECALQQSE